MKSKPFSVSEKAVPSFDRACVLFVLVLAPLLVFAQADSGASDLDALIQRAYALEQHDRPTEALALVRPLVDSGALQGAKLGRAWTLLGVAYADRNDFREAQHALEEAISVLRPLPEEVSDYASAVYDLANLYWSEGQLDVSKDLRLKALRLYEQADDRCGIARSFNALASLDLRLGHIKEGERYLKQATAEMKIAGELSDGDVANIYSTQAQFASINGNTSAAIAGYEHALEILKGAHEASSPMLAWHYMILGAAYSNANRFDDALREMRQGLSLLDRAWGRDVPRYLEAEIAYSDVLARSGDHKAAALLRARDEATLKDFQRTQCTGCTISANAFR